MPESEEVNYKELYDQKCLQFNELNSEYEEFKEISKMYEEELQKDLDTANETIKENCKKYDILKERTDKKILSLNEEVYYFTKELDKHLKKNEQLSGQLGSTKKQQITLEIENDDYDNQFRVKNAFCEDLERRSDEILERLAILQQESEEGKEKSAEEIQRLKQQITETENELNIIRLKGQRMETQESYISSITKTPQKNSKKEVKTARMKSIQKNPAKRFKSVKKTKKRPVLSAYPKNLSPKKRNFLTDDNAQPIKELCFQKNLNLFENFAEESLINNMNSILDIGLKGYRYEETDTTDRTCQKSPINNSSGKLTKVNDGNKYKTPYNIRERSKSNTARNLKSRGLIDTRNLGDQTQRDITSVLRAVGIHTKRVSDGYHDTRWANVSFGLRKLLKKMDDKIIGIKHNLGM